MILLLWTLHLLHYPRLAAEETDDLVPAGEGSLELREAEGGTTRYTAGIEGMEWQETPEASMLRLVSPGDGPGGRLVHVAQGQGGAVRRRQPAGEG